MVGAALLSLSKGRLCPTQRLNPTCRRSHGGGDPLLKLRLGGGADLTRGHFAVLEDHQSRDRHHVVLCRGLRILVDIELDDLHFTAQRTRGYLLERRRNHPAWTAPFR